MWLIDILYYIQISSFIVLIISSIAITYILYRGCKVGEEINRKTYELGKELTNEKVKDYIYFIDGIKVPDRKVYWNTLKAGYRLVKMNDNIDDGLKEKLRVTMLSKGILV